MKELGGTFARYHGRVYRAQATTNQDVVLLLAYGDAPPEPGFESRRPGIWRKHASRTELDEYYDVAFEAIYHGLDCTAVEEDDTGRLYLQYLAGDSFRAAELGMTERDHGVWEAWVDRAELDSLRELRRDLLPAG